MSVLLDIDEGVVVAAITNATCDMQIRNIECNFGEVKGEVKWRRGAKPVIFHYPLLSLWGLG